MKYGMSTEYILIISLSKLESILIFNKKKCKQYILDFIINI